MKKVDVTHADEWCPLCDTEVKLRNEFVRQRCPSCGKIILPCSICTHDKNYSSCGNCPLAKKKGVKKA